MSRAQDKHSMSHKKFEFKIPSSSLLSLFAIAPGGVNVSKLNTTFSGISSFLTLTGSEVWLYWGALVETTNGSLFLGRIHKRNCDDCDDVLVVVCENELGNCVGRFECCQVFETYRSICKEDANSNENSEKN